MKKASNHTLRLINSTSKLLKCRVLLGHLPLATLYKRRHPDFFLPRRACKAALVAISKTSLTPSLVFAEHSIYPNAPMRFAISLPSSGLTGSCFILASSRLVCSSFLRSFLFPTKMIGTLGQKCFTSGVHFSGMFSVKITTNVSTPKPSSGAGFLLRLLPADS